MRGRLRPRRQAVQRQHDANLRQRRAMGGRDDMPERLRQRRVRRFVFAAKQTVQRQHSPNMQRERNLDQWYGVPLRLHWRRVRRHVRSKRHAVFEHHAAADVRSRRQVVRLDALSLCVFGQSVHGGVRSGRHQVR